MRAFAWFMGENDLATLLIDPASGGCADGLHPDRRNENMGAESALAYLTGLVEVREFQRKALIKSRQWKPKPIHRATLRIDEPCTTSGGHDVSIQIPKPAEFASAARSGAGRRAAVQARD